MLLLLLLALQGPPVKATFQMPEEHGGAWALASSPDGRTFAGTTGIVKTTFGGETKVAGGDVLLWDPATGKIRKILGRHVETPRWLAFSPDGKSLGSHAFDAGEFKAWDVAAGKPVRTFQTGPIRPSIGFDGRRLITVEEKRHPAGENAFHVVGATLTARDVRTGRTLWTLADSFVVALGMSPDGASVVAFTQRQSVEGVETKIGEQAVRVWDAATGKETRTLERGDLGYVGQIGWLPDGKTIFAYHHGRLFRWDAASGAPQPTLDFGHGKGASTFAFSADGRRLGLVHFMGELLEVRDLAANRRIFEAAFAFPDSLIGATAFTRDLRGLLVKKGFDVVLLELPPGK